MVRTTEETLTMKYTKREITRLVRLARSMSHFRNKDHERELFCPVHTEALRKIGDLGLSHTFTVLVLPWEDPMRVAAITKALVTHLEDAEINGEPCDDLNKAPRR